MSTPTPGLYEVNFCFPIVRELENDRVKLTLFDPNRHVDLFFQGSTLHPELYRFLPFGPYPSASTFTERFVFSQYQRSPAALLYAIIDKTRSPPTNHSNTSPSSADFAGIIGYIRGSSTNLSVEIGPLIVLPPFQRTHVTTNAVGLLLRYAMNLPSVSPPGLGLRRVQWQTSNGASIRVAERMGLRREGVLRWSGVLSNDPIKVGNGEDIRQGDPRPDTLGKHMVMLAICWDDWENGGREQVERQMDR